MRMLLVLLLYIPGHVLAGESWELQVNGISRHRDPGFNETNTGLGLQRTTIDGRRVVRYMGGTLINSMRDRTWYAGAELGYRFAPGLDVGLVGGVLTYPSAKNRTLLAVLPMLTIGTNRVALNTIYIPHIANKTHAAVLFQLAIRLD